MGLQHVEIAPRSFLEALAPGFLGDPQVVGGLLARFLLESEGDLYALGAGKLAPPAYGKVSTDRIRALATKFSGADPAHPGIKGFHGVSLPAQLQAALGSFWRDRRAKWDDDAVAVLLEWLLVRLAAAWKAANGDDNVLQAQLGPDVAAARNLLLGSAKRA